MEAGYFVVESKIVFRLVWFGFEVASKESGVVSDDGPVYVSVFSSCRKYSGLQQVMNIGKQIIFACNRLYRSGVGYDLFSYEICFTTCSKVCKDQLEK